MNSLDALRRVFWADGFTSEGCCYRTSPHPSGMWPDQLDDLPFLGMFTGRFLRIIITMLSLNQEIVLVLESGSSRRRN